jgi:hypothetical protein
MYVYAKRFFASKQKEPKNSVRAETPANSFLKAF